MYQLKYYTHRKQSRKTAEDEGCIETPINIFMPHLHELLLEEDHKKHLPMTE
jgi:hypothetical protein